MVLQVQLNDMVLQADQERTDNQIVSARLVQLAQVQLQVVFGLVKKCPAIMELIASQYKASL